MSTSTTTIEDGPRQNRAAEAGRFLSLVEMYAEALESGRVDESMTDEIEAVMYNVADEMGVDASEVEGILAPDEDGPETEWREELPDRLQPLATDVLNDDADAISQSVVEGRYDAEDVLSVVQDAAETGLINASRESRLTDEALDAEEDSESGNAIQDVDVWLRSIDEDHRHAAARRVVDGETDSLADSHDADTALWAIDEAADHGFISVEREEALRDAVTSEIDKTEGEQLSLMDAMRENPEPLVYIGRCRQLTTQDGISYRGNGDLMFTTPDMDALLIVPVEQVEQREDLVDDEQAEEAFEEWHHFEADDTDFRFELSGLEEAERTGTAKRIRYTSDKVMRASDAKGDEHDYYHDFEDRHAVYELPQDDGIALLVGATADGDTIHPHGTLEISGRGILN